jgi:two-component system sensor histidine kinase KdpD
MKMPGNPIVSIIFRHAASVLLISMTTWILVRFEAFLEVQLIALIFLLPVIVSTVQWGLTPGILSGFLAFLAFNYSFIQPLHTFTVHKTQDLITLFIFLVVAVVMSNLIGQARKGVRLAQSREWEATRMYELISSLADLQEPESIARTLAQFTLETFPFNWIEVRIIHSVGINPIIIQLPEVLEKTEVQTKSYPLRTVRGIEGEIRVEGQDFQLSKEEKRLLEAFTGQAALSLERERLAKAESRALVLEESDRMKSSLLNSVSHELRSPLAAIKASVSSLRSGAVGWNIEARDDLLATIEEETDHLNQLVGNLLDMSRIESGALKPQRRWNSIGEICRGVATKMRKHLGAHNLEMDFPETLPLVPTDYVLMEQVFTNLISNSIKYAPANSIITLRGNVESEFLHIEVANQGPLVPEAHLERIFDKFQQVMEADQVTGTGLGLSICKGIVEAHGGKIWAQNRPGWFVFHFSLPLLLDGSQPALPSEENDG